MNKVTALGHGKRRGGVFASNLPRFSLLISVHFVLTICPGSLSFLFGFS
jgi:hypothetical protein